MTETMDTNREPMEQASEQQRLLNEERELLKRHPLGKSAIFLPTEKIPREARVAGLRRVVELYEGGFRERHLSRLRALRERFAGRERVFVIGNGPSLNSTDLSLLRDEVTFGVNGIFLKFSETEFRPTLYVVEDHLVAEDRADAINALRGVTKLFPINLAYCLEEDADTIFFDHRPRRRYPTAFDFSTNASACTFAGCTVTFTCLQLAYYLGFRQINLIGVDCSYVLPSDVEKSRSYAVATLDMKSDDPNHFDPNYFGKGYRWHDPQVGRMQEAYAEARRVTELTSVPIYNATIGGQLEVFPRRDYLSLFDTRVQYPRLLVLDISEIGSVTATGQLKAKLLSDWPKDAWMQLYAVNRYRIGARTGLGRKDRTFGAGDFDEVLALCEEFHPDVIYCRPVPENRTLLEFTPRLCASLGVPVVTHVMDDWPTRLRLADNNADAWMTDALVDQLRRSHKCLAIGEAMAEEFAQRYGMPFHAVANAVDPEEWPIEHPEVPAQSIAKRQRPFTIGYVGALAGNMTLQSVTEVAAAVSRLHTELPIAMEIFTMKPWLPAVRRAVGHMPGVSIELADLPPKQYRARLSNADCLLIAYNFDRESVGYVRYSMANKLPECLASGRPILGYGPREVATIRYLESLNCAEIVTERDPQSLEDALRRLQADPERCKRMGRAGREIAFERHNAVNIRNEFRSILTEAARSAGWVPGSPIKPAMDVGLIENGGGGHLTTGDVLNLIKWTAGGRCGSVWLDSTDGRMVPVRSSLLALGWREEADAPGKQYADGVTARSLLAMSFSESCPGDDRATASADLILFSVDRSGPGGAAQRVAALVKELMSRAYDVWLLEVRFGRTWWRGARMSRRLIAAPCAVGDGVGEVVVMAFREPVHPYELRQALAGGAPRMSVAAVANRLVSSAGGLRRRLARLHNRAAALFG